jgi:hypothetical protein
MGTPGGEGATVPVAWAAKPPSPSPEYSNLCSEGGETLASILKSAFLSLLDDSAVHCATEISIG